MEVREADVLWRFVEADRMSLDVEVTAVPVELRTVEALEDLEAISWGRRVDVVDAELPR